MNSQLLRSLVATIGVFIICTIAATRVISQETPPPPPPIQYLEGHKGAIYAVATSSDGETILSAGVDGTIRIWDRETGTLIRAIPAHAGTVLSLAVAPDGRRFASGGLHGVVNLFDLPRQNPLASITNVPGLAATLAVSPNGGLVATGDDARILRLWNAANNQHLRDFAGITAPVTGAKFLNDAQQIVAAAADGSIRSWTVSNGAATGLVQTSPISNLAVFSPENAEEGHLLGIAGADGTVRLVRWPPIPPQTLPGHSDQVTAVVVSHDGQWVATGGIDQLVNLDDAETGKRVRALAGQPGKVAALAFSADDSMLVSGSDLGTLKFWNTADGADQLTISGHTGAVNALDFHPKVKQVASAGADGTVRLWRLPKAPQVLAGHSQPVADMSLTGDGKVAASAGADKTIRLWTLADGKQRKSIANLPQPLTRTELSNDGKVLAAGDSLGDLRLWNLTGDMPPQLVGAHTGGVSGLAFGSDNTLIYSSGLDGLVKSWKLPISPPKSLPALTGAVQSVALSPDQKLVVAAASDGSLQIVERATGELIKQVKLSSAITSVAVSADNAIIAASDGAGVVTLLSASDGAILNHIAGHTGVVQDVKFHPESNEFLTAGADGTIRRWKTPDPSTVLAGHTKPVGSLAVSADGKQIVTASADGSARLWTSTDGKAVSTLLTGKTPISTSVWRPDGKEVAIGDAAGSIRLLNPADGAATATLTAHDGALTGLAFRVQNDALASTGADGLLRMWKLPIRPPLQLAKYDAALKSMAVSNDGTLAVTGDGAKTLHLIELAGNKETASVEDLAGNPTSVDIAADKSLIAAVTDVGTIDVYAAGGGAAQFRVVGHPGGASGVAFHPQGKQVASVGSDGTLRIWDFAAVPKLLAGHTQLVNAIALSPQGTQLATGAADNSVRIWNLANGTAVRTLSGHTGPVTGLAWSADETRLVSSSADKSARLWNVADGKELAQFNGHAAAVNDVAITPNGATVVTASADKLVKVWNVAEVIKAAAEKSEGDAAAANTVRDLAGHTKSVVSVELLSNGATVVAGGEDGSVRFWNVADGKSTQNISTGAGVRDIALSPDGKLLAAAGTDKQIRLYNPADGKIVSTLAGHAQPVAAVAFSRDNTRLVGTAADGTVGVWETAGRLLELRKPAGIHAGAASFGVDNQTLLLGGTDNSVKVMPLALTRLVAASEMPLAGVAWTPDGAGIVTGGADKTVKLWNPADGKVIRGFSGQTDAITGVAVSRDGSQIVASSVDKTVRLWTAASAAAVATLTHPVSVSSARFSPDGTRIVTTAAAGIRVWDVATQQVLQRFDEHTKPVRAARFAANGQDILSGGDDMTLRRSSIAATTVVAAHAGGGLSVAFMPKGDGVISAGADKRVVQFDLTGKLVREFAGCTQPVTKVAVRNDALQVAAICADKQVYQWQLANGQLLRKTPVAAVLTAMDYTSDGKRLLVGSNDKQVRAFDSETGQLLERLVSPAAVTSLSTLPDSLSAVVALADNSVAVRQQAFQQLLAGHTGAVNTVAWSADGKSLLSGGADKTIRHWNAETGVAIRTISGHTDALTAVAVTADSTQLISTSVDKTLRLWTLANGAALKSIPTAAVVRRIALNEDSSRVATVGDDGVVRVWDRVVGAELQRFGGHAGAVRAVAISSDGNSVVSGGDDKSVRLWPVAAAGVIVADTMKVHDLRLLPGGQQIVTAGEDRVVKLWDGAGKLIRSFGGSAAAVAHVAVSDDGLQIAAGGDPLFAQKNLFVWNAADGKLLHNVATPAGVTDVDFGTEGRIAVAGADKHLRVFSSTDGRLLQDLTVPATLSDVQFVPGTTSIAAGGTDNKSYLFDYSLDKLLTGHEGAVTALQYTNDGQQLLTAGADGTARLWDLVEGKVVSTLAGSAGAISRIVLSADGKRVIAGRADKNVEVWDLAAEPMPELKPTTTIAQAVPVTALAADDSFNRIAVGGNDNLIHIWDLATGTEIERLAGHTGALHSLAFAGDAKALFSGSVDKTARRWTPAVIDAVTAHDGAVTDIQFGSDGRNLYTAGVDKAIKSWSTLGLEQQQSFTGATAAVNSLALTADGKLLAAVGEEPVVRLWGTDEATPIAEQKLPAPQSTVLFAMEGRQLLVAGTDKVIRNFGLVRNDGKLQLQLTHEGQGHTEGITALAVADDNHTLFSVGAEKHVKRWYAASHAPVRRITEPKGAVYGVAFSPDSTLFAAGGADKTVRVWESQTGELIHEFTGHKRAVSAVTFHARGKELASGSHDGTIRVYTLADIVPVDPNAEKPKEAAAAKPDGDEQEKPDPPDRTPKPGLLAFTYPNNSFTGDPQYEIVSQIDLAWGKESSSLSRVWVGTVTLPAAESIEFNSSSNPKTINTLRVIVDGQVVIDGVDPMSAANGRQGSFKNDEGAPRDVPIRIEYSQSGQAGALQLSWSWEGQEQQLIPATAFKHQSVYAGDLLQTIDTGNRLNTLTYSTDGTWLIPSGRSKRWSWWSRAHDRPYPPTDAGRGHNETVYGLTYNKTGSRIATVDYSGNLFIWNASNGQMLHHRQLPAAAGYSVAYTPDGTEIVVGTSDPRVFRVLVPPPYR